VTQKEVTIPNLSQSQSTQTTTQHQTVGTIQNQFESKTPTSTQSPFQIPSPQYQYEYEDLYLPNKRKYPLQRRTNLRTPKKDTNLTQAELNGIYNIDTISVPQQFNPNIDAPLASSVDYTPYHPKSLFDIVKQTSGLPDVIQSQTLDPIYTYSEKLVPNEEPIEEEKVEPVTIAKRKQGRPKKDKSVKSTKDKKNKKYPSLFNSEIEEPVPVDADGFEFYG